MASPDPYWQGKEPKTTKELVAQLKEAVLASYQWLDAAEIPNDEDRMLVYAQIYWIEELLKLADIELRH